jgi:uncharacterized protein YcbX
LTELGAVSALWRYPVKSMQGEQLDAADVTDAGFAGDRTWGVVDVETGFVASAKNPRKWGTLLECSAALDGEVVVVTFPDGRVVRSDDAGVDAALSEYLGRAARLASSAPGDRHYEMLFPDIDGVAPAEAVEQNAIGTEQGGTMADMALGMLAPPATFFDLTTLHLITVATIGAVGDEVRRFRPNIVIDGGAAPYAENGWTGNAVDVGREVRAQVFMPTMRCVMTTLPQRGLDRDRSVLQTLVRENRVDIPGLGTWACAGTYATVTTPGSIAVGDPVSLVS